MYMNCFALQATTTSPNPTITSSGTQSFMNMQEADASSFRMNDFNMYDGETNQSTGNQDEF